MPFLIYFVLIFFFCAVYIHLSIQICKSTTYKANYLNNSGGEEVLLDVGGRDATDAFEDVGHSDEAREILERLQIGKLKRLVRLVFSFVFLPCPFGTRKLYICTRTQQKK